MKVWLSFSTYPYRFNGKQMAYLWKLGIKGHFHPYDVPING